MTGANIGWIETPYIACPTTLESLMAKSVNFKIKNIPITILPRLFCKNILSMPDVIRGEETQIAGYLDTYLLQPKALLPS